MPQIRIIGNDLSWRDENEVVYKLEGTDEGVISVTTGRMSLGDESFSDSIYYVDEEGHKRRIVGEVADVGVLAPTQVGAFAVLNEKILWVGSDGNLYQAISLIDNRWSTFAGLTESDEVLNQILETEDVFDEAELLEGFDFWGRIAEQHPDRTWQDSGSLVEQDSVLDESQQSSDIFTEDSFMTSSDSWLLSSTSQGPEVLNAQAQAFGFLQATATFDTGINTNSVVVETAVNFGAFNHFQTINTDPNSGTYTTDPESGTQDGDLVEFRLTPYTDAGGSGTSGVAVIVGANVTDLI